jgi:hypothetical protein
MAAWWNFFAEKKNLANVATLGTYGKKKPEDV